LGRKAPFTIQGYAAMENAMVHGRYAPLVRLFHEAALNGKP
jgi:hypothetical protein